MAKNQRKKSQRFDSKLTHNWPKNPKKLIENQPKFDSKFTKNWSKIDRKNGGELTQN